MTGNSSPTYKYYTPSEPAAILFAVLYGMISSATLVQYLYYRSWFWIFAVIASLMESVGYIFKAISTTDSNTRSVYVVQYIMILRAPAVLAASGYMCMGLIALYVTPMRHQNVKTLWIVPRFITLIFVLCDVAAFLIQVLGGNLATSTTASTIDTGFTVLQVGLGVHLGAFGLFLLISFRFHIVSRGFRDAWPEDRWIAILWTINAGSCLIFVRSIYLVFAIYNIWHPAQYLTNIGWKQTNRKKRTEIDGFNMETPVKGC